MIFSKTSFTSTAALFFASALVLSACSSDAESNEETANSSNTGNVSVEALENEPGDRVEAQYFASFDALNDFTGKVFNISASAAEESLIVVEEEISGDYNYSIYGTDDIGSRVDYSYFNFLETRACTLDIIMNLSVSQNVDFPLPYGENFNLVDTEVFKEGQFKTVYSYEGSIPVTGWIVNDKKIAMVTDDSFYFKIVELGNDGRVVSVSDYVHNSDPNNGAGGAYDFDNIVFDENGEVVLDDDGMPLLKDNGAGENPDTVKEMLLEKFLTEEFNSDDVLDFSSVVRKVNLHYDEDYLTTAFSEQDTPASWWVEVGTEMVSSPEYSAAAVSNGGQVGIASDGTVFVHTGDYYSGLNVFNPSGGDVSLKDGSVFACSPLGEGEDIEYREQLDETFNNNRETAEEYGVELDEYGVGGEGEVFIEGF